jgi:hypothetical protein
MNKAVAAKISVSILLCGTITWTACSTAWTTEAEQIIEALIPATANLITLAASLQENAPAAELQAIQSAGSQAGTDLRLLQSLIQQYQEADVGAKPGLLSQIQIAMTAVQATLNGLLTTAHIKDAATQAKVTAVVGVVISEVQSMVAIVPLVNSAASPGMTSAALAMAKRQAPLSASEFVRSYNATMAAQTGNPRLDHAISGLQIHMHGKFERWVSLGLIQ